LTSGDPHFFVRNKFCNLFLCKNGRRVSKVLSEIGIKPYVRGMIQIERQKFRCPIFCNKYSCHGRIFLVAFPVSKRRVLRQNPQRMGDNHSSYNHSLCCSPCGGMDWLGFGFHSTAPTSQGRKFRKLEDIISLLYES